MKYHNILRYASKSAVLAVAALLVAGSAFAQLKRPAPTELDFKFIGNATVRITDGERTLVTDFPYRTGASGYMRYNMKDFDSQGEVISLMTHSHYDHWDALVYREKLWTLIGPPQMMKAYEGPSAHPVESGTPMEYEGIRIEPTATRHGKVEHYSYLVIWHGVRIYIAGDTEREQYVLAEKDLDIAFVTPWLLRTIFDQGKRIAAKQVVVYHHKYGEEIVPYDGAILPEQNDTFTIPVNDLSTP